MPRGPSQSAPRAPHSTGEQTHATMTRTTLTVFSVAPCSSARKQVQDRVVTCVHACCSAAHPCPRPPPAQLRVAPRTTQSINALPSRTCSLRSNERRDVDQTMRILISKYPGLLCSRLTRLAQSPSGAARCGGQSRCCITSRRKSMRRAARSGSASLAKWADNPTTTPQLVVINTMSLPTPPSS